MRNWKRLILTASLLSCVMLWSGATLAGAEEVETEQVSQETQMEEDEALLTGEEYSGTLPVGSIVLLKDSEKKVMIIGYLQSLADSDEVEIYDYCGCLYPEGYLSADQVYLFNHSQIDKIYYLGYQDTEGMEFIRQVEEYRDEM